MQLRVNEIFYSIQGESSQQGRPCIFVRLTGCRLRCSYCDTKYAYHQGETMSFAAILESIRQYPCQLVELTGGEPLEQPQSIAFMQSLIEEGFEVMLETDGQEDISQVPKEVRIIFDVKTPSSGEKNTVTEKFLAMLKPTDEVKFVIGTEEDYEFLRDFLKKHATADKHLVLVSAALQGKESLADKVWLPEKILRDGLPVRFQPQFHKLLWGAKRGV